MTVNTDFVWSHSFGSFLEFKYKSGLAQISTDPLSWLRDLLPQWSLRYWIFQITLWRSQLSLLRYHTHLRPLHFISDAYSQVFATQVLLRIHSVTWKTGMFQPLGLLLRGLHCTSFLWKLWRLPHTTSEPVRSMALVRHISPTFHYSDVLLVWQSEQEDLGMSE